MSTKAEQFRQRMRERAKAAAAGPSTSFTAESPADPSGVREPLAPAAVATLKAAADSAADSAAVRATVPRETPGRVAGRPVPPQPPPMRAPVAAPDQPQSGVRDVGQYMAQSLDDYFSQRRAEDVQRLATPLEVLGGGLTAPSRSIAHMADEALSGNNPLGYVGPSGLHIPAVEGAVDPGTGWRRTMSRHLPQFNVDLNGPVPFGGPMMTPQTGRVRFNEQDFANTAGIVPDIALDPVTYTGVGAVTKAGKMYRAAQLEKGVGELALGGALDYTEARAATERIHRAMDQLAELEPVLRAEGTLSSRGRAMLTLGGQTNPVLSQGNAMSIAQRVLERAGQTRVSQGMSHLFQPTEKRVPLELKARWMSAANAAGVGKREALRALSDLIDEYPDVLKAVGGDVRAFDDALAVAHEMSMARQYKNAVHWLTEDEKDRFFKAASHGDKDAVERLQALGLERARQTLPSHLSRAERHTLRQAEGVIERNRALREQLAQPMEYTEQLGQKELSARERSELQRLLARRAKVENRFLKEASAPQGVGLAGPVEGVPPRVPKVVDRTEQLAARVARTKAQLQKLDDDLYSRNARGLKSPGLPEQREALQQKLAKQERDLSREKQRLSEVTPGDPGVPAAPAPPVPPRWATTGTTHASAADAVKEAADINVGGKMRARVVNRGDSGYGVEVRPIEANTPQSTALGRVNDEARIAQLQQLAVDRATRARQRSLAAAARGETMARGAIETLAAKAQARADAQALQASIRTAQRMFFRGLPAEAKAVFGEYAEKLVPTINARNLAMFSATRREGVRLSELSDAQAYMLHATTPEAQDAILAAARERGEATAGTTFREWSEKHAPQETRKLRMSAVEANELGAQGKLSITGGRKVKQFFYTNPLIAQIHREAAGSGAIGYARFAREAAAKYGRPAKRAPKGWRTVPNDIEGIGDKVAFEPEVADLLTRHYWALKDPWRVVEAYDRMNQIWKTYTLGIYPNYHVRNEISDLWNAVVLGDMNIKWVGPAMDGLIQETALARRMGRKPDLRAYSVGGGTKNLHELRDEAEAMGVLQSGIWQRDIEQNVLGSLVAENGLPGVPAVRNVVEAVSEAGAGEAGARALGSKVGAGLHAGQRQLTDNRAIAMAASIGNMREQAFRFALYLDRRALGWGPEASAMWVKKHLIDYGQLSNFEQEAMKRVFPFYTWTRHNAALQLEYLFAKPGGFAAVQHLRENAAGDEGFGPGRVPLPTFLQEGMPIRTGTTEKGDPEFWRLEGLWPGTDALTPLLPALDPQAANRKALSMLSPFIQEPIEQGTNTDWFRSLPNKTVPIEAWPGEEDAFLGVSMPKRTSHVLGNLRPLTEMNRLNPFNVFGTDTEPGVFGNVTPYPQPDQGQRWANLLYGRGYAINEARNQEQWQKAFDRAVNQLEWNIQRAEAQGKWGRAEQARRQLQYLREHPESISPDMAK